MPTPKQTRVRAYDAAHRANPGKTSALAALLPHWQRGLVHVQMLQVRAIRRGERPGYLDTRTLPGYLSQRQWKSVVNQVNAALRSWSAVTVQRMRPLIREVTEDEARRKDLYRASKMGHWFIDPVLAPLVTKVARADHPFPDLSRVRTMLMDGPIAQIEDSRTRSFRWWVRFSLTPGERPVRVPLAGSPYMDSQPGTVRRFCQVSVSETQTVTVRLVKASTPAAPRDTGGVLGLDWGLANLLTTSDGRRYGRALYSWLRERDAEITDLAADLQRQGIRPRDSRRYRRLNERVRAYVDNEVGRILNRVTDSQVQTLVAESLDFRGKGLSKTLRRVVSRAGRSALRRRLASLPEDKGVDVTEVAAAYTSQECSGCGFASRDNRSSQAGFRCRFCGKSLHADVNAARTIRGRRSSPVASPYTSKVRVLAYLDERFESRWGIPAGRVRERQVRPCSRASSVPAVGRGGGQLVE